MDKDIKGPVSAPSEDLEAIPLLTPSLEIMSHTITVSGADFPPPHPPGSDPVAPPRLNIAELIKNDKQWALYIQALGAIFATHMYPMF
jgi:hypothetical protein